MGVPAAAAAKQSPAASTVSSLFICLRSSKLPPRDERAVTPA
jgi:hypothetical protein